MKILYLEKHMNIGCNYYTDIINYLKKNNKVTIISKRRGLLSKIVDKKYNIIIIGFGITDCGNNAPPPLINDTNTPCFVILNKEYTGLNKKLDWIVKLKPTACFTVHHDFKEFEKKTNIPFHRIMWSANPAVFKDYKENYKYDFFFSGVIRQEQTNDWRTKIYKNLNRLKNYKLKVNARFQSTGYAGKHYSLQEYAKLLACSKICLTTTGPADLVGTRYFEIMAGNRALILCNKMKNPKIYGNMLIDGFNCVMFSTIDEFIEKVTYYLSHEQERIKIVRQAYKYFNETQNWDCRVKELIRAFKNIYLS